MSDLDFVRNNQEAAITGALVSDELFLHDAYDSQKAVPHYKVDDYNWLTGAPSHIWIDRDSDWQADGQATIDYDIFGGIETISIDRNYDGKADAVFNCEQSGENDIKLEFDDGIDGAIEAKGSFSDLNGRSMRFYFENSQRRNGQITFIPGFQGPDGMNIDSDGDYQIDTRVVMDRYVPEGKVTSFGKR
jgi:hypothetical protein